MHDYVVVQIFKNSIYLIITFVHHQNIWDPIFKIFKQNFS